MIVFDLCSLLLSQVHYVELIFFSPPSPSLCQSFLEETIVWTRMASTLNQLVKKYQCFGEELEEKEMVQVKVQVMVVEMVLEMGVVMVVEIVLEMGVGMVEEMVEEHVKVRLAKTSLPSSSFSNVSSNISLSKAIV